MVSLLVVVLDHLRLAVPLDAALKVIPACEVIPLPGAPEMVVGAINLRGEAIAVVDLRRRLRLAPRAMTVDDHLLVVRTASRTLALIIDEAEGVSGFPDEAFVRGAAIAEGSPPVPGVVRLEDGLLLIQDPEQFLDASEDAHLELALQDVAGHAG
jgi:purine-binding chemotaxis protein CheW